MKVYIILTHTGTVLTRLIRLFTRKPFNHASISFDRQLSAVYSFGRKNPKNPFCGGFVQEDMEGILFRRASCAIYSLEITEDQFERMKEFLLEVEKEKEKYRYNLLGLFYVLFNKERNRDYAYFCSEFVATMLDRGGVPLPKKSAHLVRPYDFAECGQFELVFQGPLQAYLSKTRTPAVHMAG